MSTKNTYEDDIGKLIEEGAQVVSLFHSGDHSSSGYESWYSEAKILVQQVLPERLSDFVQYYEGPDPRSANKITTPADYTVKHAMQGVTTKVAFGNGIRGINPSDALPSIKAQLGIVKSAEKRFDSSLFDISTMVRADLFDDEIEAADELNTNGYYRAAGMIAGVVLESHVRVVVTKFSPKGSHQAKKKLKFNDCIEYLKKNKVIDVVAWNKLRYLMSIRNNCAHSEEKEPTKGDIDSFIKGVHEVIKVVGAV